MHYFQLIFSCFLLSPFIVLGQIAPSQPLTGPGSSDYQYGDVISSDFTSVFTGDGYWLFEPNLPKPDSADVVIFNHGWGVYNPGPYGQWIEHLVKKGNIVIFPKYEQNDSFTPTIYTSNAATGIANALLELQTNSTRVKPRMNHIAMIGHSFGGVITANLAIEYTSYSIPKADCFMLCEAGPGSSLGHLSTYSNMETSFNSLIIVGNNDIIVGNAFGKMIFDSTNIPTSRKNYIVQYADNSPVIEATHNEPLAANNNYDGGTIGAIITGGYTASKIDAVDYFCYWKLADALISCTFYGTDCNYAFGDTPEQRNMGIWDNGNPLIELEVYPKTNSIREHQFELAEIFPNPTNHFFSIANCTPTQIDLFTINGVHRQSWKQSDYYDIKDLSKGIYLIKITSDKGSLFQKLIKE